MKGTQVPRRVSYGLFFVFIRLRLALVWAESAAKQRSTFPAPLEEPNPMGKNSI